MSANKACFVEAENVQRMEIATFGSADESKQGENFSGQPRAINAEKTEIARNPLFGCFMQIPKRTPHTVFKHFFFAFANRIGKPKWLFGIYLDANAPRSEQEINLFNLVTQS